MKLVIEWLKDGGYECGGFLTIACLEYESEEAFYIYLEKACLEYIKKYKKYRNDHEKWHVEHLKLFNLMGKQRKIDYKEKAQETWKESLCLEPKFDYTAKITLNNVNFPLHDFIITSADRLVRDLNFEPYFKPPEIKILEKWWLDKSLESLWLNP